MNSSKVMAEGETLQNHRLNIMIFSVFILWFITFFSGLKAAASVWWVSEIFHHCAFVLPISIWLIYQKRHEILDEAPRPNYFALPFIILLMLIHIFGVVGEIQLFQYVGTFGILPFIAWLFIGTKACSKIIFPLFFIGFAIPVGDELIPVLQEVTADLSVFLLKFIGTPVLRENLYIEIPNGRFFVAEACSGISFLIVSIVFGNLYAYLSFQRYNKKILFLVLSFTVPIIANSLRVFGIVLIGHYFGMEYATGTDHLVYGWVFYCFVLFLLIVIGEKIRDPIVTHSIKQNELNEQWCNRFYLKPLVIIAISFVGLISWQSVLNAKDGLEVIVSKKHVVPISISQHPLKIWQPNFKGYSEKIEGTLSLSGNTKVDIYMVWYDDNSEGELVSSANHVFNKKHWTLLSEEMTSINKGLLNHVIIQNVNGSSREVVYGYIFNGQVIVEKLQAKIHHTLNVFKGDNSNSAFIAVSFPYKEDNIERRELINLWLASDEYQSLF